MIEINPQDAAAYVRRGIAYRLKGNSDRAIADFSKAIEINPNDASAYSYRGSSFNAKGDHDRAIADFTKAIEINPQRRRCL